MNGCVFCSIVANVTTASLVYEDSDILAFMDIRPVTPGPTLVIPKRHSTFLADLDEATGSCLMNVTLQIAWAIKRSGVRCEGVNLFLADGEAAGQEVLHVHMHVIPRYKGDNFLIRPEYGPRPTRQELNATATSIKSAMPCKSKLEASLYSAFVIFDGVVFSALTGCVVTRAIAVQQRCGQNWT